MSNQNVVSIAPLRISFVGGATDLPYFYKEYGGAVVSMTIDKYVRVEVSEYQKDGGAFYDIDTHDFIGVHEHVPCVYDIEYDAIRECICTVGGFNGLEIKIHSDMYAGAGLGGSSALIVGLLNALYRLKDDKIRFKYNYSEIIARMAAEIDMKTSNSGKQDAFAAACGGFKKYMFMKDDSVNILPLRFPRHFDSKLMLFDTGISKKSDEILGSQKSEVDDEKIEYMMQMKAQVLEFCVMLLEGDWKGIGRLLDEAWHLKKRLAPVISNSKLDEIYETAKDAGAIGGKLLGAGGGGHFLFVVNPKLQPRVVYALQSMATHIPFRFESRGVRNDDHI